MAKMLGRTHFVEYGGRRCVCCYHAPSDRKTYNRAQKRRERQVWKREAQADRS